MNKFDIASEMDRFLQAQDSQVIKTASLVGPSKTAQLNIALEALNKAAELLEETSQFKKSELITQLMEKIVEKIK